MVGAPVECDSLTAFVEALAGGPVRQLNTIYGIPLRNRRGERAAYVGRTDEGVHPRNFLDALRVPKSDEAGRHPDMRNVPGRLYVLWERDFYYSEEQPVHVLRNVPRSAETAAARALEDILGEGLALGGVLALDARVDVVRDSCALLRLHDRGKCCKCGHRGHGAASCPTDLSRVADNDLPYRQQRMERRMVVLQRDLEQNRASLQAMTPLFSPPAQGRSSLSATPPEIESAQEDVAAGNLDIDEPLAVGAPFRRRLRGKQSAPQYPRLRNRVVQEPLAHDWSRVVGVSHSAQTNADFGARRSFQVSVARAQVAVTKLYFRYQRVTLPGMQPCGSAECWQKAPGQALNFCGRDVCAYDAATTCHAELLAARPDKRRRLSEAGPDEEAAVPPGDLESWKTRWL
jgi:hypothetical protein